MATITDEMRAFAHGLIQGKTESEFYDLRAHVDIAAQANRYRNAELQKMADDQSSRGLTVDPRIVAELTKTDEDAVFNEGVLEYMENNRGIFGIVPDPYPPTTASPTTAIPTAPTTTATPTAAPTAAPPERDKLGKLATIAAVATFPMSLAFKSVRQAMVGRTKEILGIRPPLQPGESRTPYLKTPRGRAVAVTTAIGLGLGGAGAVLTNNGNSEPVRDPSAPAPSGEIAPEACVLDEDIAKAEAEASLEASGGDPVKAVALAEEMLSDYGAPLGPCDDDVVEFHQQTAAEHIADLAAGQTEIPETTVPSAPAPEPEPDSLPTVPDSVVPDETIYCEDGEIVYDDDGELNVTDMPSDLWEGSECDIAPGNSANVPIGNNEVVKIEGRSL